ncbi:MAG: efflux RND transporter permease subunit [Spirochaetes bacterium]|nr:efflux RND transporter permease subunit [Spirochaetota bacterium]
MNIAQLSIKRPIFISSLVILLLITGRIALNRMGVDLFPDVTLPIVVVTTTYPGAAPEEIENLISRPLEDELVSVSGVKRITSRNYEGTSLVVIEFPVETDVKDVEQQVRDRVALVRPKMPDDVDEPLVRRFDPFDVPVARIAISADMPPTKLYDLAKEDIKARIEQVKDVGSVRIIGGTRREIQVELDMEKMQLYQFSATSIANKIKNSGVNIPAGKHERGAQETIFRAVAQFESIQQIKDVVVSFSGDFASVVLSQVAEIKDGTEDATSLGFLYAPVTDGKSGGESGSFIKNLFSKGKRREVRRESKPTLMLDVFKQSGSNTVAVAEGVGKRLEKINRDIHDMPGHPRVDLVYDGARWIRINIDDVFETIILGVILAVVVVYLFLGNVRSTIITGIALPNSLLGAFVLMYLMGFTINMMSLLALSLTVGLLVDDAIVVRENIFRKLEHGFHPVQAAEVGTMEVALAVIATTSTIIAVFFPIGFMSGIVGQFFKQFGFTVVFAMLISLFDALTVAPLLSAYFAGKAHARRNRVVVLFDRFQDALERYYEVIIRFSLKHPLIVIGITTAVFFASLGTLGFLKKTFFPETDQPEFMVNLELPPGTSLEGTREVTARLEERIKKLPEVNMMSTVVGGSQGEANKSVIGVTLIPSSQRKRTSFDLKAVIRDYFKDFAFAKPNITHYSTTGSSGNYPFMLSIAGSDLPQLEEYAGKLVERLKKIPDLIEINTSLQAGRPEFQIQLEPRRMQLLGVESSAVGLELRYLIAGEVVGQLHENGLQYDVRMRLRPEQRDLKTIYSRVKVPNNLGGGSKLIPLSAISRTTEKLGSSYILRQDRARVVQVNANIAPGGGVGDAIDKVRRIMRTELPLPQGVTYSFIGQTESYGELVTNMMIAFVLSLVFIYLVLSSLYESFITPFTILVAIPPALSGALFALLLSDEMLSMMSMIGIIMLMGLVTKNSILLVDFTMEGIRQGLSRDEAILKAGIIRLRPILMTTFAMIAGTIPVAFGLGEAAATRTAMGMAILGGLIISTMITLFVVPAIFGYIDRFREAIESRFRPKYDMHVPAGPAPEEPVDEPEVEVIDPIPVTRKFPPPKKGRKR